MPLPSPLRSAATALILPCALLASSCADKARIQPQFPPAADVEAGQRAKPRADLSIATNPEAAALHNAAVEGWGDGLHDAWVRSCRWFKRRGAPYDFACGETSAERAARLGL